MGIVTYLLGAGSALLVGFSKTGLPGVSLPAILLMAMYYPGGADMAMGALLPVLLTADVFAVSWFRRHAQWDKLIWLFPSVVAGMVPGWLVLTYCKGQLLPIIGGLVLFVLILELCRSRLGWDNVPKQWWFSVMMGMLAGAATIIAHAAMPIMTIYLISQGMDKEKFIGTAAWFFFIVNLTKVPFYFAAGMITAETLRFDLFVAPVAVVGGFVGAAFLSKIPQKFFNVLALVLAAVAAVHMIVDIPNLIEPLFHYLPFK